MFSSASCAKPRVRASTALTCSFSSCALTRSPMRSTHRASSLKLSTSAATKRTTPSSSMPRHALRAASTPSQPASSCFVSPVVPWYAGTWHARGRHAETVAPFRGMPPCAPSECSGSSPAPQRPEGRRPARRRPVCGWRVRNSCGTVGYMSALASRRSAGRPLGCTGSRGQRDSAAKTAAGPPDSQLRQSAAHGPAPLLMEAAFPTIRCR